MGALKFTGDKETDNIETVSGLDETIKDWLESISMPFEGFSKNIENFEFRSRDGFRAHSHNKGGVDLFAVTSVASLIGSGEHIGTQIEEWTENSWDAARKDLLERKENKNIDPDGDQFFDMVYSYCSDDYESIAYRIRVMYEGNGVLTIYSGYDKDAPYFRWNDKANFETTIKFRTISGLKRQLEKITKKIEKSQ